MKIRFLGATGTVTGSRFLVTSGDRNILVDCGLFQGYKQLRLRNREPFPVEPSAIDEVILTHAHLDHSGYLPLLARNGFRGKIWCSYGTRDLCHLLLPDSGRIQEEDARFANRQGFTRHSPASPLYNEKDARRVLRQLTPVGFEERHELAPGVHFELLPGGHIIGASIVRLTEKRTSIIFSGDLGRNDDLLMNPPARDLDASYVVVESTYGNRRHPGGDPLTELEEVVNRTATRGGVIVIPAFAVGRSQAILWGIHQLKAQRRIPELPVWIDSPMATSVLELYTRHVGHHRLTADQCEALSSTATIVNSVAESKLLSRADGPRIIVSASGMATGGRVLHHLRTFAPDPKNTILFSGYQAGGTRGAQMVAGEPEIRIHGEWVPVRAEVAQLDTLSAHADGPGIVGWLKSFASEPQRTFVVHGEADAADALRRRIEGELGWNVTVPETGYRTALRPRLQRRLAKAGG